MSMSDINIRVAQVAESGRLGTRVVRIVRTRYDWDMYCKVDLYDSINRRHSLTFSSGGVFRDVTLPR